MITCEELEVKLIRAAKKMETTKLPQRFPGVFVLHNKYLIFIYLWTLSSSTTLYHDVQEECVCDNKSSL